MLLIIFIILALAGIDVSSWVWWALIIGEPIFWLVTLNLFKTPE